MRGAKKSKNKKKWAEDDPRREHNRQYALEHNIISRLLSTDSMRKAQESNKIRLDSMSAEERKKLTDAMNSEEARNKAAYTKLKNTLALTEEEKIKKSMENSDRMKKLHTMGIFSNAYTDERNEKIKISKLTVDGNPQFTEKVNCPHCGHSGQYAAMKRWHFDKCKFFCVD